MTVDEAQAIFDAHQRRTGQATGPEFMAYVLAKGVLAEAGRITVSPAQRAFIAHAKRRLPMPGEDDQS